MERALYAVRVQKVDKAQHRYIILNELVGTSAIYRGTKMKCMAYGVAAFLQQRPRVYEAHTLYEFIEINPLTVLSVIHRVEKELGRKPTNQEFWEGAQMFFKPKAIVLPDEQ